MVPGYVSVTLVCRCGYRWQGLCVRVDVGVPVELRCRPGPEAIVPPGASRCEICCRRCGSALFPSDRALRGAAEEELRRGLRLPGADGDLLIDCR